MTKDAELRADSADAHRTRRAVAKMNYSLRDKEITHQREELALRQANAEAEFQRQLQLKLQDEKVASIEVQKLKLRIKLEKMQRHKGQNTVPVTAVPSSSSDSYPE